MPDFDHIQYGRLLGSVDALTQELRDTTKQIRALESRLGEVEGRFKFGKGALAGLMFAAGTVGIGVKEIVMSLFGR